MAQSCNLLPLMTLQFCDGTDIAEMLLADDLVGISNKREKLHKLLGAVLIESCIRGIC